MPSEKFPAGVSRRAQGSPRYQWPVEHGTRMIAALYNRNLRNMLPAPPRLLFVDDSAETLDLFAGLLPACQMLLHRTQTLEELTQEILVSTFECLLLDGQLAGGLRGWDVLRALCKARPGVRCIGFSSDPRYAERFLQAGAVGFVHKDRHDPEASAAGVLRVIQG
jgi:CheY-like chemotaxis protein